MDALAGKYDGRAVVIKVDVDKEADIADKYGVEGIPTVVFLKDGKVQGKPLIGAFPRKNTRNAWTNSSSNSPFSVIP